MSLSDPLLLFRNSIAASSQPLLSSSADVETAESSQTDSLALATHLYFSSPLPQCVPLNATTRFTSTTPDVSAVDLRSIYFAWIKKDVPVNEYIALAQELDGQLPDGQRIRNLVFVERLDLITWLEGASDESEYIQPLEGADLVGADAAGKAADVAGGAGMPTVSGAGIGLVQQAGMGGRPVKIIDARLQEIYNGERPMGDRNSVLRGVKPTVSFLITLHRVGKASQDLVFLMLTHSLPYPGLFSCQESSRDVPGKTAESAHWAARSSRSGSEARTDRLGQSVSARSSEAGKLAIQASRSHHPPLALGILAAPLIQYQVLS